tara:strand:- start:4870 stop:6102 length:1233 start_codon:yes stop_codon:yes gene_type:complete
MRKVVQVISLILFLFPSLGKGQTLDDYLVIAAENNPDLKASYTQFKAALQRVNQVNALADPRLSFGYFISPIETRVGPQRARLSLTQIFPWFGTLKAKESSAKFFAEAKYQHFLDQKNKLFWQVHQAYYPLLELDKHIDLVQENIGILKTYKRLATSAYENNRGSLADVIRVDIMIENADTELSILKDQKVPLRVNFNRLLNRADTAIVQLSEPLDFKPVEQDYRKDSLLVKNPQLTALDLQNEAIKANEQVAKKAAYPQFGVGVDYAFIGERTDVNIPDNGQDAFMPMVSMRIPIFRKKYKAAIKEAELGQESIQYQKEAVKNRLISNYEQVAFQLRKAEDLIQLYDSQIKKSNQLIQLLYSSYSNSVEDFEEVLRMQQQLLKYEMAKVTALKNHKMSLAEIEYLTFNN